MHLARGEPLPKSPVPPDTLDRAETLPGLLCELATRFPDFACLTILDRERGEQKSSLADLWSGARRVARLLAERGLPRGRVVVIALPTGPALVSAYFGALLAGGVPALVAIPLNRVADRSVYRERVLRVLGNAEAAFLYGTDEVVEIFHAAPEGLPPDTQLLTPAAAAREGGAFTGPPLAGSDLATVQYSSGSTGVPNGVLLSHRAILNNVRAIREAVDLGPEDVSVNWIPLYHDMGLIDGFLLPLLSGCPTVLIPTQDFMRQPARWLFAIHRYRGAMSWAPNFAFSLCAKRLADRDLAGLDLSSWRLAISASEPILGETIDAFAARFAPCGFRAEALTPVYGLAENVTAVTAHPAEALPRVETLDREALAREGVARPVGGPGLRSVSVGRPLPRCRVEIRDEARRVLPERCVGNIWIQSDCMFEGYRGQPERSAATLVDGWLDSGDRGYRDGEDLFFVSREKDLIVVGGDKIAPHDVESVVNTVPGVRLGCAVALGVPSPRRGTEDVVVVAETKEEDAVRRAALESAIRRRVLESLGLVVQRVLLVPPGGVEKTTSGKLARRATRERYAER